MRGRWNWIHFFLFYVITLLFSAGAMTLHDAALLPETENHQCYLRNMNMAFQTLFWVCFSFWLSISVVHRHEWKKNPKPLRVLVLIVLFVFFSYAQP